MVVRPPLDTAGVAAKPTLRAGSPFRLKVFSSFRAFVDRHVRAVPLCIVVSHLAFTAAEFLPRNVAGWNEALPTVQTSQLVCHEAISLACFFHLTTLGKVQDYLTLTLIHGVFRKFPAVKKPEHLETTGLFAN